MEAISILIVSFVSLVSVPKSESSGLEPTSYKALYMGT